MASQKAEPIVTVTDAPGDQLHAVIRGGLGDYNVQASRVQLLGRIEFEPLDQMQFCMTKNRGGAHRRSSC